MANICCDDVYFYSESNPEGLRLLWEDLEASIVLCTDANAAWIGNLFQDKNMDTTGVGLRGTVSYMEKEDDRILLCTEAAWNPLYDAYHAIAAAYQINFVMQSMECGNELYYNTDSTGSFFPDKYIVIIENGGIKTPCGDILEQKLEYGEVFATEQHLLQKFADLGYPADTIDDLKNKLAPDGISIHTFENPYEDNEEEVA